MLENYFWKNRAAVTSFFVFCVFVLFILSPTYARSGKLKIYTEDTPPANFVQNGTLTGVCTEMVREIQSRIGDDTRIQVVPWARGYSYLKKQPNTALFATTKTKERVGMFHWVGPMLTIRWSFFGLKERDYGIETLEDAKKVESIGTYIEDAKDQFLRARGFENLVPVRDSALNLKKMVRGRLDLLVSSNVGLPPLLKECNVVPERIVSVYEIKKADLYLAFSRSTSPEILGEWKRGFCLMVKDGTFERIFKKWLPDVVPPEPDCSL